MNEKKLIGKTIQSATIRKLGSFEDVPFLDLKFTDGSKATIISEYGDYSANAEDEYVNLIRVEFHEREKSIQNPDMTAEMFDKLNKGEWL